jgi:hypothetical protein
MRIALFVSLALAVSALGQEAPPDAAAHRAAIAKLDFMVGQWEGSGWDQRGPKRTEFTSKETVRPAAGGTLLLIEGNHKTTDGGFDAFGLVAWNETSKAYEFRSYTSEACSGLNDFKVTGERRVEWSFAIPQGRVRYTVDMGEADRWVEAGEFSRDGNEWRKFFEMTLKRVK